jgi:hypothetical protein
VLALHNVAYIVGRISGSGIYVHTLDLAATPNDAIDVVRDHSGGTLSLWNPYSKTY